APVVLEARFARGLLEARANRDAEALVEYDASERLLEDAGRVPGELHGQLVLRRVQALSRLGRTADATAHAAAALARARASTSLPRELMSHYLRALSSVVLVVFVEQGAGRLLGEAIVMRCVVRRPLTALLSVHS